LSINCIQNIAKPMLVLITVLTGACGGGGGGDDNPGPNGPNPQPQNITPLTQQQCGDNTNYIWVNDQCTVEGNESVTHVEAIEQLPQQDREDLLQWIKRIDKIVDFRLIFPNWGSGASNNNVPQTTFIDGKLLKAALNDRSIIEEGGHYYVLGDVHLYSGGNSTQQSSSQTSSTNNTVTLNKNAKVHRTGNEGIIYLYDLEVYRFKLVDKINIAAHFGRPQLTVDGDDTVELSISAQSTSGEFNAESIMESYEEYYKAADDSRQAVAEFLQVPDEFTDSHFESVNNVTPFTYKANQAGDESSYFNHDHQELYAPKDSLEDIFVDGEKNITVTGFFKSANLNDIGIETPDHTLSFSTTLQLTVTEDNAQALTYTLSDKQVAFNAHNTVNHSTELALTSLLNRDELIKGSPRYQELSNIVQAHSPSYKQLAEVTEEFLELADRPMPQAMMNNTDTKRLFLKKASPHYGSNEIPTSEDLRALGQWAVNLGEFFSTQTGDTIDDATFSTFAEAMPAEEPVAIGFYENIADDFETLMRPVSAENYPVYSKAMLSTLIKRIYYNRSISDLSDDLAAAIGSANEEFSASLLPVIRALGTMTRPINAPQWRTDAIAEDRIARTPNLLTSANKANLLEHDQLAANYDITPVIPILYTLSDQRLQGLPNKNTALINLNTFADEDRADMANARDFGYGIRALANLVYEEEWAADIYAQFRTVMSFNYRRGLSSARPDCTTDSMAERYDCLSSTSHKNRISTEAQVGYLAEYPGELNPYVEYADKLAQVRGTIAEISLTNTYRFSDLDRTIDDEIAEGLWITCSATQIRANVDYFVDLSNTLQADITANPNPSPISDPTEYNRQSDLSDSLLESFDSCTNS
jgi:hypothetical protein